MITSLTRCFVLFEYTWNATSGGGFILARRIITLRFDHGDGLMKREEAAGQPRETL